MTKKDQLIEYLNEDLAAELGTIIRYNYQASKVYGLVGMPLRDLFRDEIEDELGHAAFLSDVVVDLGGEPTIVPKEFDKVDGIKAMLEQDIALEMEDVKNYILHAELAAELGEVEVKLQLEEFAADEAGHARELGRILRGLVV
jgi:bacterioferritin